MHRSSESVAAIATALAKAQTELSNPEKAMVGTVYNTRLDTAQNFRYASLSSGLDIIRKALGSQQIAVTQTTDIDRPSGTVNLTTILLHTSGEWISSDWPVCRLSETTAPRRMVAALTYARRYALFTMVGIAGEDDLDAPDLMNDAPKVDRAEASPAPIAPAPRPSSIRVGYPTKAVPEKISVDESAAVRAQLIREIEAVPESDLEQRAVEILKAKNRLSLDDAKQVEGAFAERMAQRDALPETADAFEAGSVATDLTATQPVAPSVKPADPRRPRPRKLKGTVEIPTAAPVLPKPIMGDQQASPDRQANDASANVQTSELTISKERRLRDKAHLRFVASHPCLICGRSPADAHHLRFAQPRAMGLKVSDEFTVPLCRAHHQDNHRFGDEQAWWVKQAIDPLSTSRQLWASTRRIE